MGTAVLARKSVVQTRKSVDQQKRLVDLEVQDRHLERLHRILNTVADIRGNAILLLYTDQHRDPDRDAIAHIAVGKSRLEALIAARAEPRTFEQARKLVDLPPIRPMHSFRENAKAYEEAAASAIREIASVIQSRAEQAHGTSPADDADSVGAVREAAGREARTD
jgi:hypothetical protein